MKNVCIALLTAAGFCAAAPQEETRPAKQSQSPQVEEGITGPWRSRLRNPYIGRSVSHSDFRNTGRFQSLIRAGNLYLSLNEAISLALENNLDIQLQRYTIATANAEILRTSGGGLTRGLLFEIRELPAGIGGPGSPFLTTVGGTTPTSNVPASAVDLAPIQGTTNTLTLPGTIPFSAGTPIPQFDPVLAGNLNYQHQNLPQTNQLISGANNLLNNSLGGNLGFNEGFSPGTSISAGFNTTRLSTNSTRTEYNPYLQGSLNLTVTQPLLQGFGSNINRRYIRVAKNERKISDELFRQQLLDTLAAVERLYWDLVSLNEDVRVKRQAVELAQKLFEDNQTQVEVGTLAPIEVKRAKAQLALSRQDLTNSTGLVLQQELVLKNVLTRRGTSDPAVASAHIIPSDIIQVPAEEPVREANEMIRIAYTNRPDLKQADLQVENANTLLAGSKNALLPQLNLVATVVSNALSGDLNSNYTAVATGGTMQDSSFIGGSGNYFSQIFRGKYPSYSIGLQLNLPLRNRVAQADYIRDEIIERQTEVRRQQLTNQVRLEVENALLNLQRSRASYDAAVETRQLQQEALDAEQQRYQVGASTTYLVIQYQRDLAQSRSTEVITQGNYAKAKAALDRALGRSLETYGVSLEDAMRGEAQPR